MPGLVVTVIVAVLAGCSPGSGAGDKTARPAPVKASPSSTGLAGARWEGRWEFNYTLTKLNGASPTESDYQPGARIRRIWTVTPRCTQGPCDARIISTDPDAPASQPVTSSVTYGNGLYRISEDFAPQPDDSCTGSDGRVFPGAFRATNVVEARPTKFVDVRGKPFVTELSAVKITTFTPVGSAATAGGGCKLKSAQWEGSVKPAPG